MREREIVALYDEAGTPEKVRQHCAAVARLALATAKELNERGAALDAELIHDAAMLHDVKRHEKDHAAAGADFLRAHGLKKIAEMTAAHMDAELITSLTDECAVVYLADKRTSGTQTLSLGDRLSSMPPEKRRFAQPRIERAQQIESALSEITRGDNV